MAIYGYIRKRKDCSLLEQIKNIESYQCIEIFIESEPLEVDRELMLLTNEVLSENDTLIIYNIQSFGKNIRQLKQLIDIFEGKNIRLISIKDNIDTEIDDDFYRYLNILGEYDSSYHANITKQGITKTKKNGVRCGRPQISEIKKDKIMKLHEDKYTIRDIAKLCSVSIGTVHKYARK